MALDVVFGWHLDGLACPETISGKGFELGTLIVGPAGLTNELALRLGLFHSFVPQAIRIANYMRALESCDDGQQFYSKSFSIDPWSTASCLLVMREQVIFAGWNGKPIPNANKKLQSFAKVEPLVFPLGSPAEVFRSVLVAVESDCPKSIPIRAIKLVTPEEFLPVSWHRLFSCLRECKVSIDELDVSLTASTASDLGRIQTYLKTGRKDSLRNDGTFCLLESDDEYQLSEVTAAWLAAEGADLENLVILRGTTTPVLDASCSKLGLPRAGGHENSRWRSALQIMPLMFETCWLPANPYRTLELIALPGGPIPRSLSYHFVQALRVEPGFGGERWASAWKDVEAELRSNILEKKGLNCDEAEHKVEDSLRNLRYWLEPNRFDPDDGIPVDEAIRVCRHVHKWAASNLRREGASEIFHKALNLAEEMKCALKASGFSNVKKIQLNRMLDAVAGEGCRPEKWHAQCAPWSLVDHPAQIWDRYSSLLWWGFSNQSMSFEQSDFWTPEDLKALEGENIRVERPVLSIVREAHSWRQPILNAQEKVILCRSRVSRGQQAAVHPLWHELEEMVTSGSAPIVFQAHDFLMRQESKLCGQHLRLTSVDHALPPPAFRIWKAPPDKVIHRKVESYTSIRELLGCPMAWVLRYHVQLHPTVLLELPRHDNLIGDIAHKVFQRIFQGKITKEHLKTEAELCFDELANAIGLPLLQPGMSIERSTAKRAIVAAVCDFSEVLSDSQLEVVACEVKKEAAFFKGAFSGSFDILLRDREGRPVILDFKWNRTIKRKIEELESGQNIQLASYAWLEHADSGKTAQAGYYMLRQRRLIYGGDAELRVGEGIGAIPLTDVWQKTEKAYISAMERLLAGVVCARGVTGGGSVLEPDETMMPVEPPCKFCPYGNVCGAGADSNA